MKIEFWWTFYLANGKSVIDYEDGVEGEFTDLEIDQMLEGSVENVQRLLTTRQFHTGDHLHTYEHSPLEHNERMIVVLSQVQAVRVHATYDGMESLSDARRLAQHRAEREAPKLMEPERNSA